MIIPGERFRNHQRKSGRIMKENGDALNIADYMYHIVSPLNEIKIAQKNQQIIYNSNVPISGRRDAVTEDNGATVTASGSGEYRLRATTATNSKAVMQTRQRGNYIPGNVQEAGLGMRVPTQPTGDAFVKWGYFKDDTGIYCRYDSDGLKFIVEDGGIERLNVSKNNFNQNTLNDFNMADGAIFQFPFVYYGYGPAYLEVGLKSSLDGFNSYVLEVVHSFNMEGSTTISEPNLPLSIECNSGTSGVQLDAYVGGRQINSYGQRDVTKRLIGDVKIQKTDVGTTYLPLVSFKHKAGYENIGLKLQKIEVISDNSLIYRIIRNGSLTAASFGTATGFTNSETATQWDIAATAVTGGDVIKTGLISGQNKDRLTQSDLPQRILNEGETYTLAVRRVAGVANATVTGFLEISEGW